MYTCYFSSYFIHLVSHTARPEGSEVKILNPLQKPDMIGVAVLYQRKQATWNIKGEDWNMCRYLLDENHLAQNANTLVPTLLLVYCVIISSSLSISMSEAIFNIK